MTSRNNMRPIHPGEHLREELETLGVSARQFAKVLGVPVNRITGILKEQRAITADTALRLARYFGTTPEVWLNLQSAYELRRARQVTGKQIERAVTPRAACPLPSSSPPAWDDPTPARPAPCPGRGTLSGRLSYQFSGCRCFAALHLRPNYAYAHTTVERKNCY